MSHRDQGLDRVDVLCLHLRDTRVGSEQGEPGQRLDEGVPLQLEVEDAGDPDGAPDALEAEEAHLSLITILKPEVNIHPKNSQKRVYNEADFTKTIALTGLQCIYKEEDLEF